jgi:endonuclease/exonuclease/phosphatase family metal-dependent hydrolase
LRSAYRDAELALRRAVGMVGSMTIEHTKRRVAILAAALVACSAAPAAAADQVGTFNMAGQAKNKGKTAVAEDVMRSMLDRRPLVMTLQEVCYTQFHHLRAKLNSLYAGAFFKVPARRCKEGNASFGNAVFWRRASLKVNYVKQYPLGSSPGLEQRQMGCVKSDQPRFVACSVHLTNPKDQATRQSQHREMAKVAETVNGWASKYPVVVSGDFNARPGELLMSALYQGVYGGGAAGLFREVSSPTARRGEPSHDKGKLDYIFASPGLNPRGGDATKSLRSDHRPVWGVIN